MKITQIIEATTGGTRRHLRDLMLGLESSQCHFSLLYADRRDPQFNVDLEGFRQRGINLKRVDMCRRPAPLQDAQALMRIERQLRKERPDLVHTHSAKAGFLGRIAASKLKIPVIHTPHVLPFEMKTGSMKHLLYMILERIVASRTRMLISVSRHGERVAQNTFRRKMPPSLVIHNGINAASQNTVAPLPANPPPVIGLRARYCRQKGHDVALKALVQLKKHYPDARIILQGGGDDRALRKLSCSLNIQASVDFISATDDPTELFSQASIMVLPSRWEGCPYSILESMAARRPVIASNVGGIPEIIKHDHTGLLVPPEDPQELADALRHILNDGELRSRLMNSAEQHLKQNFTLDEMLKSTKQAYLACAAGRNE